jgi:hypothetical protein
MAKVAIVVLADTETQEGLGRIVNALEDVKSSKTRMTISNSSSTAPGRSGFPSWKSPITNFTGCIRR